MDRELGLEDLPPPSRHPRRSYQRLPKLGLWVSQSLDLTRRGQAEICCSTWLTRYSANRSLIEQEPRLSHAYGDNANHVSTKLGLSNSSRNLRVAGARISTLRVPVDEEQVEVGIELKDLLEPPSDCPTYNVVLRQGNHFSLVTCVLAKPLQVPRQGPVT